MTEDIENFISDNKLIVIEPGILDDDYLNGFRTELKTVFSIIKRSTSLDELMLYADNNKDKLSKNARQLINTVLEMELLVEDEEEIEVCKAMEELRERYTALGREEACNAVVEMKEKYINEGREVGREEGVILTYVALVRDGLISMTDAAARLNVSEDELMQMMK